MFDYILAITGLIVLIAGITVSISALISYKIFEKRLKESVRLCRESETQKRTA